MNIRRTDLIQELDDKLTPGSERPKTGEEKEKEARSRKGGGNSPDPQTPPSSPAPGRST
jgi:hypothetical protein